jgi:hypothetical protein
MEHVTSPGDWRSHPCGRGLAPGEDVCRVHLRRREAREAQGKQRVVDQARGDQAQARARELTQRLGAEVWAEFDWRAGRYTGRMVVSAELLEGLVP